MKRLSFILCSLLVSTAAHAVSWADLWLTKEQQAQRLLDAGKPADAADKFQDARRRAYAEIKAGEYDEAAKRLEGFEDPLSQYNRGNALARSGKLEDALAAYDEAIKQTPADSTLGRDARHNRELVAKQLEKQQQASQSRSGGQSQSGEQSRSDDRNDQRTAGNQGEKGMQSQDGEQRAADGSQQQNQDPGQQGSDSQGEQRQAQAGQSQSSQDDSASSEAEKAKQEAADARRDAEAALAQSNQNDPAKRNESASGRMLQPGERPVDEEGKPVAADEPPSEQTLALDQWLRQIPDDPAGLLRRKFLIEHLKRQQESRQ